jgi:hypothetical protein
MQDSLSRKICGPKLRKTDLQRGKQGAGGYVHLQGSMPYYWGEYIWEMAKWGWYGRSIRVWTAAGGSAA